MTTLPRSLPAGNAGPQAVRALLGDHCDGDPAAEAGFDADPLAGYDPAATFDLSVTDNLLLPLDLAVVDVPPPFPEPPAGVTLHPKEVESVAIYRTAWPHLDAAQRAEVARLITCTVHSAERWAADQAERAAAGPTTPLQRDWCELARSVDTAAAAVEAHAAGWVAAADPLSDPEDDAWPHDVPEALAAAGWVLLNIGSILTGESCDRWDDAPHHRVFPLAPLLDPDPDHLPEEWDGRRDKLADLVALVDDVVNKLGRCLEQHDRLPDHHPLKGTLLDGLGGGQSALDAAVTNLRSDLCHEVEAAAARRKVARLRIASRTRDAEAERFPAAT